MFRSDWPHSLAIRLWCWDLAKQGYGWEDIMVKANVPRSFARWLVLGTIG